MAPEIILASTIVFLGLGYHFIFLAQSDDFHSPFQRVYPFVYWLLTGIGIARGVSLIDSAENNVMITISLSVAALMIGLVVGHLIARGLRYRVRHPGEDVYRELLRMKNAVEEDIRRSNPKYPTLVGYKMAMLWNNIKMDRSRLAHEQKALAAYKLELRRFREQWGNRVPRTDAEWREFWLGFKRLEDLVEDVQNGLSDIREDLQSASVQGLEIVEQNGVDVMMEASDPVKEMEELLDRARSMSNNET